RAATARDVEAAAGIGHRAVALVRVAPLHRSGQVERHHRPLTGGGRAIHDVDGDAPVRCVVGGVVIDAPVGLERHAAADDVDPLGALGMDRKARHVVDTGIEDRIGREQLAGAGAAGVAAGALAVGTVEPAPVVLAGAGAAAAISPPPPPPPHPATLTRAAALKSWASPIQFLFSINSYLCLIKQKVRIVSGVSRITTVTGCKRCQTCRNES